MDKDSVILKYIDIETDECEKAIYNLAIENRNNEKRVNEAQSKLDEIYKLLGKEPKVNSKVKPKTMPKEINYERVQSYNEIFDIASKSLLKRGLDIESINYHDLVSEEQLKEIIEHLNRPLEKKEKWVKSDFIVVFVAASIGSLIDLVLSNRDNKLTGQNSDFSKWLNGFHKHQGGAPIDYQGEGFSGGFHRELSKGHDILRFIEAIIMFKTGTFEGVRYKNGVAEKVISTVNQYGNTYEQLGMCESIVRYAQHMFADLLSTCSLPFPGSSFLAECSNREVREFSAIMYSQGFNIKNILIQSTSTIGIELIIRIYYGVKAAKKNKTNVDIKEDYSNFAAFTKFIKPENTEKLYEMLLLSHTIVVAINVGKVVITKKPWEINITEIISVVRYGIKVLNNTNNRNSGYGKLIRNSNEIEDNWDRLLEECLIDNIPLEFPKDILTI